MFRFDDDDEPRWWQLILMGVIGGVEAAVGPLVDWVQGLKHERRMKAIIQARREQLERETKAAKKHVEDVVWEAWNKKP